MVKLPLLYLLVAVSIFTSKAYSLPVQDVTVQDESEMGEKDYNFQTPLQEIIGYAAYDLIYQRMEWQLDPAVRYIKGKITSYIKSQVDGLEYLEFDLDSTMEVDSVKRKGIHLTFSREDAKLNIQLPERVKIEGIDSVEVYYQGEPVSSGFGSFTNSWHGIAKTPVMWTLSEPYGAMEWWPCKQSLTDKIDSIDVIVTTPEPYRTASNGILVSETVTDSLRTMHWKHRYPIATYLVAIAVTDYVDYSEYVEMDDGRKIEILNFVYPESYEKVKDQTPVTVKLIEFFNKQFGEYPFSDEKYGHAEFGWGGGMEHQTMSFMGSFDFELIAHELAHQWFGDYITLGSWKDIWLNEGFATYLTGLAVEEFKGEEDFSRWKKRNLNIIRQQPEGSVFVKDTMHISTLFSSRLSYSKGAYLLHMLRWVLGDEAFFEAINNYYEDIEIANGFARHDQLVEHFEAAGDTILTEFFNDWYYGEGYPVYSINYMSEGTETEIQLSQRTTNTSVNFFEMPVPLRLYAPNYSDSMDVRLYHTQNDQLFTIDPGFHVSAIVFDPDNWLIASSDQIVQTPVIKDEDEVKVYPNPFKNYITIAVSGGGTVDEMLLFNSSGNKIEKFNGSRLSFNWSHLPHGIYFLRVYLQNMIYEKKIMKH